MVMINQDQPFHDCLKMLYSGKLIGAVKVGSSHSANDNKGSTITKHGNKKKQETRHG